MRPVFGGLNSIGAEVSTVYQDQNIKASREELILACKGDLDFLAGMAMSDTCTLLYPPTYKALWQLLTEAVSKREGFDRFDIGLPRGFAKTTVLKLLVLHIILFTDRNFVLVVCRTADLAEAFLADVADMLGEINIVATFGDWTANLEQSTQEQKVFSFRGRNIILKAVGAGSKGVRGRNRKNYRPDVILMDDMQDWDNSASPVLSEALLTWMVGTLMKASSKFRCCFIFVGNMYPFPGCILRKLKTNPTWVSFITGGLLADGESLWPELQSKEQLLQEYANDLSMGRAEIFLAEILNDETASGKSGIDITEIRVTPDSYFDEVLMGNFIIIDPANDKVSSDMSVIGYFEVRDGIPALVELLTDKWDPGQLIQHALFLAVRKGCKCIAVESVAYQYSLLYWFDRLSQQVQLTGIEFVEVHPQGVSKNARIKDMLGLLANKKLLLSSKTHAAVVYQITHWNPLRSNNVDDILDVLAYAYKVLTTYEWLIATEHNLQLTTDYNVRALRLEDNSLF